MPVADLDDDDDDDDPATTESAMGDLLDGMMDAGDVVRGALETRFAAQIATIRMCGLAWDAPTKCLARIIANEIGVFLDIGADILTIRRSLKTLIHGNVAHFVDEVAFAHAGDSDHAKQVRRMVEVQGRVLDACLQQLAAAVVSTPDAPVGAPVAVVRVVDLLCDLTDWCIRSVGDQGPSQH